MTEFSAINQELAWEVRRLAGNESAAPEWASQFLDFGDTPWIGYQSKPWGLIGVQFNSEYMRVHGKPRLIEEENHITASTIVESRYRSVRATGEVLCDRELYDLYTDGTIKSVLSVGELTTASEVGYSMFSDVPGEDMTATILRIDERRNPLYKTEIHETNEERLEELNDLLDALPKDSALIESVNKEIAEIEAPGEESVASPLKLRQNDLYQLLGKLRLLEEDAWLGTIDASSVVHNYMDKEVELT